MMVKLRRLIISMYVVDAIVLALMILAFTYGERAEEAKKAEPVRTATESVIEIEDSETATTDHIPETND